MKKFSKLMAALLALVMCLSLLPATAFAAVCAHWDALAVKSTWETVSITPATCTENAVEHQKCSKCGATRDHEVLGTKLDHTWSTGDDIHVSTNPTCGVIGTGYHYCKVCGTNNLLDLVSIPALGHNWVITKDAVDIGSIGEFDTDVSHTVKCTRCKLVITEFHSFNPATCTAPATCACGKVELNSEPLGHDLTHHDAVAATCTTGGNIEYWSCSRCGKNFSDANGNTAVTDVTTPATHKLVQVNEVAATCVATGTKMHYACSVCQEKFQDAEGKTAATEDWLELPVDPENHAEGCKQEYKYLSNGTANDEQHWKEWSLCHKKVERSEENHQYHEGERECYVCGYNRDIPHTHVYGEWNVTVAPTEDTVGSAERSCECGDKQTKELPALGSGAWSYAVATRSTCATHGAGTYTYTWGEENSFSVSVSVELPLDSTNHVGETEVRGAYAATATTDGYTGNTYCTSCNGLISTGDTLPATGTVIEEPDVPLGGDTEIDEPEVPLAGLMTRAEFVNYLYVRADSPAAGLPTFDDVAEDYEYAQAIGWAQANGIAKGVGNNEFAPDELVTVEQALLFLERYAEFMGIEMPVLDALTGKERGEILDNADEVLAEFFGEEYVTAEDEAA